MRIGDEVPDFELPDQDGVPRRLSTLLTDGPVVLFFYPAAMTSGCTAESCHFRDLAAEFAAAGAQRVGISADAVDKQAEFDRINSLGYPLLSDPDGAVAGGGVVLEILDQGARLRPFIEYFGLAFINAASTAHWDVPCVVEIHEVGVLRMN